MGGFAVRHWPNPTPGNVGLKAIHPWHQVESATAIELSLAAVCNRTYALKIAPNKANGSPKIGQNGPHTINGTQLNRPHLSGAHLGRIFIVWGPLVVHLGPIWTHLGPFLFGPHLGHILAFPAIPCRAIGIES